MKIFLGLFCLLVSGFATAQEVSLAHDERGKLLHYEIVEVSETSKDKLQDRALAFFKNSPHVKLKSKPSDTLMRAEGKMVINKTALVLNRPSGEIKYNFYVECRENKYRFWLTDFTFIPYQRDRYGNFVAATTVGTPLETEPGKLNAAEWKGYVNSTAKESAAFSIRFKDYMLNKEEIKPAVPPVEKISTVKW